MTAHLIPATTNFVLNPSFEVDLGSTSQYQPDAGFQLSWARTTARAWDGVACARGTVTASTAAGALSDLGLFPLGSSAAAEGDEFALQGRVWPSTVTGLQTRLFLAFWTAGRTTYVSDFASVAATVTTGWNTIFAVAIAPAGTGHVDAFLQVDLLSTGINSATVDLDGVQLERGGQPTQFAIGSYGAPYHKWSGAAHASTTIRTDIPYDLGTVGERGALRMTPRLFRATYLNEHLEELTDHVISADVTMDPDRAIKWTLKARMTGAGYAKLTPYNDFLAPTLRVDYPDGTSREGQLGLFVVKPSPATHTELTTTVDLNGEDPTSLLALQGFGAPYTVTAGTNVTTRINTILTGAGFGENRRTIPASTRTMQVDTTWDEKQTKLKVVNELLRSIGYYTLGADNDGTLTSFPYRDLKRTQPAKTYAANLPDTAEPTTAQAAAAARSEVVGAVTVTPVVDRLANKVVVVLSNPRRSSVRIVKTISNPIHPSTIAFYPGVNASINRTTYQRIYYYANAADNAMDELGRKMLQEVGSLYHRIVLAAMPDPKADLFHGTVDLAVYNARQEPVAVGRYWCRGVTYGMTRRSATMRMDLARLEEVESIT